MNFWQQFVERRSLAMKHEKSVNMAANGTPPTLKRRQQQHLTETNNLTRSPITKAFDFLPWPRSRSKAANSNSNSNANTNSTANCSKAETERDRERESNATTNGEVHYHRNIFRSGGGLIRDILAGDKDKLQREKEREAATISTVSGEEGATQAETIGKKQKSRHT